MNIGIFSFIYLLLSVVGCGETTTSQLTEQFPILRSGPLDMEFAFIPSGTFRMGSTEGEEGRHDNESVHWVKLTQDYWMQTTEVTIGQWFEVMDSYPDNSCWADERVAKEHGNPIVCVSWEKVKDFIDKLNLQQKNGGFIYSLPSEAQWEYAARGYTETSYSIDGALSSFAWFGDESNGYAHSGKKLKANTFGLYDVHGNTWEWVNDWFGDYPKADSFLDAVGDPRGPKEGERRVGRGGSYRAPADACRSAARSSGLPKDIYSDVGFRLMRVEI